MNGLKQQKLQSMLWGLEELYRMSLGDYDEKDCPDLKESMVELKDFLESLEVCD